MSWKKLFTNTILAAYFYLFMEWLFFATKSSFMDALPIGKKLEVFFLTGLATAALPLPGLLLLGLLGFIPGPTRRRHVFQTLGAVFPALMLAALSLLLLDNFTYTLFKVGVVTSQGGFRAGYGLLAVFLLVIWYRQMLLDLKSPIPSHAPAPDRLWQAAPAWLSLALLFVSFAIGLARIAPAALPAALKISPLQRQPNIILIGSDGVVANRMSLYGYARHTTPRLEQLAQTGLLAENNFTNSAKTTGSVASILTGKYPAQTRLLYSPDILHGEDAFQHLPGILQRAGYTTVEIAFPYYVDAYDLNFQEAFDSVNGRSLGQGLFFTLTRRYHLEDLGYFLPSLYARISTRLMHIFFIQTMPDPYAMVNTPVNPNFQIQWSDEQKMKQLFTLLAKSDKPLFVHVHLMGTHGEYFDPRKNTFSAGEKQPDKWMKDFYDDAMLDFDAYVGELVDTLTRTGLFDHTVLAVYSDHADQWRTNAKIPLLFHFPNGEYAGRLRSDTQNLDIAPTLLDYLGLEKPVWMMGQSLLRGEMPTYRPIFTTDIVGEDCERLGWWCIIDPKLAKPPFYQFGLLQMVVCQRIYTLNLNSRAWTESVIWDHTAPCRLEDAPSPAQARGLMVEHLRTYGFDVSTLK